VAIDHFAVAAGEHGDLEPELADAAAHAIDGGIVLTGISGVEDQPVDRPDLDLEVLGCCVLRKHIYLGLV
jgi:hypothetical protein